jgi:hypothetical protein
VGHYCIGGNITSLCNPPVYIRSKKETIPFLSYFLPGKVDDDNSSYQVFLMLNLEFGEAKSKADPKPKSVKATKLILEVKETEEDKEAKESNEINNVEQTIDELLAADVKALEAFEQEVDQATGQNLYDEIKVLDVKLEVIDIYTHFYTI